MKRSAIVAAVMVMMTAPGRSQDAESPDIEPIDRKLAAFCQTAILQDRGLTCTPFASPSDRWIAENLLKDQRFREALRAAERTSDYFDEAALKSQEKATRKKEGRYTDSIQIGFRKVLAEKLTADELRKLPGVYLRLEGLMALGRPEFARLFDEQETQEKIFALANDAFGKKAARIHQALFTGPISDDEMPLYHAELRTISAELDLAIMKLLNESERTKVWDLLAKSKSLNGVVRAPPPR